MLLYKVEPTRNSKKLFEISRFSMNLENLYVNSYCRHGSTNVDTIVDFLERNLGISQDNFGSHFQAQNELLFERDLKAPLGRPINASKMRSFQKKRARALQKSVLNSSRSFSYSLKT